MKRCKTIVLAASLLALAACADSGDDPPQEFSVTLTGITAVKQGSDEAVPIGGVPAQGATLTITGAAP